MHEYGIAVDIMESILKEVSEYNAKEVKEITLDIGPLTMVNNEQLLFCLQAVADKTIAENMKVKIETLPVKIKCNKGHESEIKNKVGDLFEFITTIKCPVCGEKAELLSGRELILKEIIAE